MDGTSYPTGSNGLPIATLETLWAIEQTRVAALLRGIDANTIEMAQAAVGRYNVSENVGRVAVVEVVGLINKRWTMAPWFVNSLDIRQAIEAAADDPSIEAILLRIDSPGGAVDGLAELGDAIYACRDRKSVIAQVTGMCASAAYYIASQAEAIYAQRMDLVGSIGVRMLLYDWSAWFDKAGVKAIPIDTGVYKSTGAVGTPLTDEQRAYLQDLVDQAFADFLDVVSRGRGLSVEKLNESADGRVFYASEAIERGLIDGIRMYEETLAEMVGDAKIITGRGTAAHEEQGMNETDTKPTSAAPHTAEPKAATLAELKAKLPGSDAEFREECIEAGLTLEAAAIRLASRVTERSEAQARELVAIKAAGTVVGVDAVGTKASKVEDTDGAGDVIAAFEDAFNLRLKAGMERGPAMRATVREDPDRHAAYLAAYNARAAYHARRKATSTS